MKLIIRESKEQKNARLDGLIQGLEELAQLCEIAESGAPRALTNSVLKEAMKALGILMLAPVFGETDEERVARQARMAHLREQVVAVSA